MHIMRLYAVNEKICRQYAEKLNLESFCVECTLRKGSKETVITSRTMIVIMKILLSTSTFGIKEKI